MKRQQRKRERFDTAPMVGVARRCRWGAPQVVVVAPVYRDTPFPTTFWLTCPYLCRRCGELETEGGIAQLERAVAADAAAWRRYHRCHALVRLALLEKGRRAFLQRRDRSRYRGIRRRGVGGIDYRLGGIAVKCLHLQVASWLGMGRHPAAFRLRSQVGGLCCTDPGAFPCLWNSEEGSDDVPLRSDRSRIEFTAHTDSLP
ncbi:MAG: DUF501 domain-containing protein [Synergistales bacterium]|nr:DUF501 domain-containing protein [Synergistales bacterium]